jgi:hypothetical protein
MRVDVEKWDAKIEIESILKQMPETRCFLGVFNKMVGDKQQKRLFGQITARTHRQADGQKKNLYLAYLIISSKKFVLKEQILNFAV